MLWQDERDGSSHPLGFKLKLGRSVSPLDVPHPAQVSAREAQAFAPLYASERQPDGRVGRRGTAQVEDGVEVGFSEKTVGRCLPGGAGLDKLESWVFLGARREGTLSYYVFYLVVYLSCDDGDDLE